MDQTNAPTSVTATPADGAAQPPIFQRLDQSEKYPYSFKEYVRRMLWAIGQATLWRYSPPRAFRFRRWLLRHFGAKLADNTWLRHTTVIAHPWLLEMEEWSNLARDVTVYNLGPIFIGRHSVVSQGTYLGAGTHASLQPHLPLLRPPIRIGRGVWIGAQAFIGPGVSIGDNSIVGARAVVSKDVPRGVIVAGNPARVIKPRPMPPAPAQ